MSAGYSNSISTYMDNNYHNSFWCYMPDTVLLYIFQYLSPKTLLNAGVVCKSWCRVSRDEFLWKALFHRNYKVDRKIGIMPGATSWLGEYKRLSHHIPLVNTEKLTDHAHQVLHVSFSNNGKMFATCSKDGYILVWNSSYPCSIRYQHDMKSFSWKYTQFSQFNESDTLLLVSGVHFGTPTSTSGEIAVFSLQDGFALQCRVVNKPYDIFGTWFSDQHLLSGDLHWLAHLVSTSILWLNKASQEVTSEHVPIMYQMYKFYNTNASSIRAVMIANCRSNEIENQAQQDVKMDDSPYKKEKGNPLSYRDIHRPSTSREKVHAVTPVVKLLPPYKRLPDSMDYASPIEYNDEYRMREIEDMDNKSSSSSSSDSTMPVNPSKKKLTWSESHRWYEEDSHRSNASEGSSEEESDEDSFDPSKDLNAESSDGDAEAEELLTCEKFLIFTTGSKTYTPHQIGFKRVKHMLFPRRLDPGLSLRERLAQRDREREIQNSAQPRAEPNWLDYDSVADRFDKTDQLIDLHGHIIGMGLSPDHRYLYVNSRPWPEGYHISNPLEPPPIAQEIDIHVIDLTTLKRVGTMLRAHKAYTPNTECFFIFLDVCKEYVASGAEDKHGYLWDRHYGICLAKFPHLDVVNSVAFNPRDPEMLVTTSDDYTVKVWRSAHKAKKLHVINAQRGIEVKKVRV